MTDQTRRAKALFPVLLLVAIILGGVMISTADAAPTLFDARTFTQTTKRLAWTEQHIDKLNRRNDYLHRYIRNMRRTWQPPAPPSPVVTPAEPATPTSSSAPTTTYTSSSSGWADELAAAGFPTEAIPTMLGYIERESGGDPSAINSSSGACGLLQLYPCYGGSAWLDPMTNLRLAHQKYEASGFAPWGG